MIFLRQFYQQFLSGFKKTDIKNLIIISVYNFQFQLNFTFCIDSMFKLRWLMTHGEFSSYRKLKCMNVTFPLEGHVKGGFLS